MGSTIRRLFNIIGGILTLASTVLPWRILNGAFYSVFEVWSFGFGLALIIPFLIMFGACFSVLSRYGGALTLVGTVSYVASLPEEIGLGSNATPPDSSFGVGYWTVWAGAIISLMGRSWNLPLFEKLFSGLMKSRGGNRSSPPPTNVGSNGNKLSPLEGHGLELDHYSASRKKLNVRSHFLKFYPSESTG